MGLRIALCQCDIAWEQPARNLARREPMGAAAEAEGGLLPELFVPADRTGTALRHPDSLIHPMGEDGRAVAAALQARMSPGLRKPQPDRKEVHVARRSINRKTGITL